MKANKGKTDLGNGWTATLYDDDSMNIWGPSGEAEHVPIESVAKLRDILRSAKKSHT